MPIGDFLIPGIGAAASIVGGAISRGQALRDRQQERDWYLQDREYNNPMNQLKRIHEAGLPSAAFFGGSATSQSTPFSGNTNPSDNGVAEAGSRIGKYFSTRMERIQTETAQTNLDILKNQKKISDLEVQDQLAPVTESTYDKETGTDTFTTLPRVIKNKRQKERIEDVREKTMNIESELKQIEKDIRNATKETDIKLVQERFDNLVQDTLGKIQDVKTKTTSNKYQESELQYRETLRTLRREFWGKLRTGEMPKFREILNILMLALENRL